MVHRRRRTFHRQIGNSKAIQGLGVMRHMIPDEGGDEVVGVIVARLHPHVGGNAGDSARFHEAARKKRSVLRCVLADL